ncbi:MAG: MarR family transcriptional regulator [Bacteroidetes bacterium]|jgi:DNA-binding MarR family transcriptional regulator|nr:MarR family transcriptional regulator [Bacteroidota bacterium]
MNKNSSRSDLPLSELIDLDATIGFQASQLTSRLRRSLLDILNHPDLSINPDELGVLTMLSKEDMLTMSELADRLMKDNANMTRAVKVLRDNNFVKQKKDEIDRRVNRVTLTPKGKEEVRKAWELLDQMTSFLIHNVSEEDRLLTCDVLKTINENLSTFLQNDNAAFNLDSRNNSYSPKY